MPKFRIYSDGSHSQLLDKTRGSIVIYANDSLFESSYHDDLGFGWSDVAEYRAVRYGLQRLLDQGLENEEITWFNDNEFVMNQMSGKWRVKDNKNYSKIAYECKEMQKQFRNLTFKWIPREMNTEADALSKINDTDPLAQAFNSLQI